MQELQLSTKEGARFFVSITVNREESGPSYDKRAFLWQRGIANEVKETEECPSGEEVCQKQIAHVITFSDLPDIISRTGVLMRKLN